MTTSRQALGDFGEKLVAQKVRCPGCKARERTLRLLPTNFKCADLICDFCGYLAQVKSVTSADLDKPPKTILGAAWLPQKTRMDSGIYFPLFVVLVNSNRKAAVYYLPRDLQSELMFVPRRPLSSGAKRAGWQGYLIDLSQALGSPVLVWKSGSEPKNSRR